MKLAQCWDDGVTDDIRLIEILRRHGARASFNLNAATHKAVREGGSKRGDRLVQRLARGELVSVYEGFLVANHTLTHPKLTQIAPEEARREIREGRDALEQIFGYDVKGFAYPYGDFNEEVAQMVREAGHCYARTCQTVQGALPIETPMVQPTHCHFLAVDFWDKFEAVCAADGVFYFWGHSYELDTEDHWSAFEEKIRRLSAAGEWVDLPEIFSDG